MQLNKISHFYEKPAKAGKVDNIFILFHGYAMRGEHMIRLFANNIAEEFSNTHFYAPNGLFECMGRNDVYDWLGYTQDSTPGSIYSNAKTTENILSEFIADKLQLHGLDDSKLVMVGFSQGARMALHLGLRRKIACAGILGYSGALSLPEHLSEEMLSLPRVKLVHGDDDQVVDISHFHYAYSWLKNIGVNIEGQVIPKLGHRLNNAAIESGVSFLKSLRLKI